MTGFFAIMFIRRRGHKQNQYIHYNIIFHTLRKFYSPSEVFLQCVTKSPLINFTKGFKVNFMLQWQFFVGLCNSTDHLPPTTYHLPLTDRQ